MNSVSVAANSDWEGSNPGTFRGAMWLDADPPPLKAALPRARPSKCFGVFLLAANRQSTLEMAESGRTQDRTGRSQGLYICEPL